MATINTVILMGNLTRDPEVRSLPSGVSVAELRLAINEEFKDKNGAEQKRTCYVDVQAWDRQAEFCRQYLHKGDAVLVEGRLDYHEWQTDQGEKRNKLRVRAMRVSGSPRGVNRAGEARGTAVEPLEQQTGGGSHDDDETPF